MGTERNITGQASTRQAFGTAASSGVRSIQTCDDYIIGGLKPCPFVIEASPGGLGNKVVLPCKQPGDVIAEIANRRSDIAWKHSMIASAAAFTMSAMACPTLGHEPLT